MQHITYMAQIGYPYMRSDVLELANAYAKEEKKTLQHPIGRGWFRGFLRRWPAIGLITPQNLDMYRARATSAEAINKYYQQLEVILEKYQFSRRPRSIFNIDETGCQPSQKPGKVVAPKNMPIQAVTTPRSPNYTLIAGSSASGQVIPPYIVLPGARVSQDLYGGTTPGTTLTCSKNGWSNGEIFEDYMKSHFAQNVPGFGQEWLLVLFDGHKSHTGLRIIDWAKQNKIVLFLLPPHSSWKTQPLDVGLFRPFKQIFRAECSRFMRRNPGLTITRYNIIKLICSTHAKSFTPSNVISSFSKPGIHPLNKAAISSEDLMPAAHLANQLDVSNVPAFFQQRIPTVPPIDSTTTKRSRAKGTSGAITEDVQPPNSLTAVLLDDLRMRITRQPVQPIVPVVAHPSTPPSSPLSVISSIHNSPVSPSLLPQAPPISMYQPSTSRISVGKSPDFLEEIYSSDTDSDDDVCCKCGLRTPTVVRQRMKAGQFVNWLKCSNHSCGHWVHEVYCAPPCDKTQAFYCSHCSEE